MKLVKRSPVEPTLRRCVRQGNRQVFVITFVAWFTLVGSATMLIAPASAFQGNPFAVGAADEAPVASRRASLPAASNGGDEKFQITPENSRSEIGLVVRSVRMSNPETADQILDAVETLLNVGAVADARFYLDRLIAKNLAPQQLFDLYQVRGPEFFYQLHATDELAPNGRELAKLVLATAKTYAMSPQRIDQLVRQLSDEKIDVRSSAFNQLKRIGPPAYAAMFEVFADASRETEFSGVRGAAGRLGDDATQVLIAAARSKNPRVATESIVALTRLRSTEAMEVVGYLYLSPKTPASVKELAADALQRNYGSVDAQQLYRDIQDHAKASLKVIETNFDSQATVLAWNFNDVSNKFQQKRIPTTLAAKRAAAVKAEMLYEIDPDSAFNRQLFLLTQLEAAKRDAGPDQIIEAKTLLKKFGNPSPAELNDLLKQALRLKLMPAAIGICELIRQQADVASLLTGSRSQLIEAMLSGDRHLQFAAFEAVVAIDPQTAFPGSSHVMEMAAFLAKSEGTQKAMVGHLLGPSSQPYSSVVAATGLKVSSARNGREFYNQSITSPDFELFIVTQALAKPSARELIQLLRSDWRTAGTPIAFVANDAGPLENLEILARTDPLLRPLQLSFNSKIVASQIDEIRSLSSSWPVTAAHHLLHGQVAIGWMMKMIDQRDTHGFYQIQRHQESVYRLLAVDSYTEKAFQMIAKMGTEKSQQALADFASQSGNPIEQRKLAAAGFSAAVKKFGTLLTTDQIQQQYDRYNASQSQPKEVQKLMADMLDAIEQRSAITK